MMQYLSHWLHALDKTGLHFTRRWQGQSELQLERVRHGNVPRVRVTIRELGGDSGRRVMLRVRLSRYDFRCIGTQQELPQSVSRRARAGASELLTEYPMLADTMRKLAQAAENMASGQPIQQAVDTLLQTSDASGALPIAVDDSLLARGVSRSHPVQLGLYLG